MPHKELSDIDVKLLLESVTSEKALKELDLFFKASPKLRRLRDYGFSRGIKFGIGDDGFFINKAGNLTYSSLLVFSKEGLIKEKIILIPAFIAATAHQNFGLLKGKWLEKIIFALAHEIGHIETLQEIPRKECESYKSSCLYKEGLANGRALEILRKNKIRMKKRDFLEYAAAGIKADGNHLICLEKRDKGSCPYLL